MKNRYDSTAVAEVKARLRQDTGGAQPAFVMAWGTRRARVPMRAPR